MIAMTSDRIVRRKDNHVETELDGEAIVMHVASGQIYGFADSAREIWMLIKQPIRCDKLLESIVAAFDVAPSVCSADVSEFLAELQRLDMIEIAPVGNATPCVAH